jgi:hypothetical protein
VTDNPVLVDELPKVRKFFDAASVQALFEAEHRQSKADPEGGMKTPLSPIEFTHDSCERTQRGSAAILAQSASANTAATVPSV